MREEQVCAPSQESAGSRAELPERSQGGSSLCPGLPDGRLQVQGCPWARRAARALVPSSSMRGLALPPFPSALGTDIS